LKTAGEPESGVNQIPKLLKPRFTVAPIVSNADQFRDAIEELAAATGPLAVDAERASGFKYTANSYLFQFFRSGSRIFLIDPIHLRQERDLIEKFNEALMDQEWIIHASLQDLPCIREFGFRPEKLFDTELGARLAGLARVGLGPLTEDLLGLSLAKEHSAVDWSYRPLHPEWKNYAALDVDVLLELQVKVEEILKASNKLEIAHAEFQAILNAPASAPRKDPWRRTSGIHKVKGRRSLAIVRELWLERDNVARERDLAPSKIMPDLAISEIAIAANNFNLVEYDQIKIELFASSPQLKRRGRDYLDRWSAAIVRAISLPERDLPQMRAATDSLPPVKVWREKAPLAYARLTHARFNLQEVSQSHAIPLENLLLPELVRRLCWSSEKREFTAPEIEDFLEKGGARSWQIALSLTALSEALTKNEALVLEEKEGSELELTSGPEPVTTDH
jgi:ribonuclease D